MEYKTISIVEVKVVCIVLALSVINLAVVFLLRS